MVSENVKTYQYGTGTAINNRVKALDTAITRAQEYLIKTQSPAGYWVGELQADASVSAGYIPLMYFMTGQVDPLKQSKVINYVKSQQKRDGSWSTYYGGPGDLNVTIQVYFALKMGGVSSSGPEMRKARDFILSRGGLMKANTITRVWLALFGQFDYRGTPSIPPEIVLLPDWFYFNIYEFSSWSRETIMALIILLTVKPVCPVPEEANISELFVEPVEKRRFMPAEREGFWGWKSFFLLADSMLKKLDNSAFRPLRNVALKKTEKWVVNHQEIDGSWGGIMLPWVYSLIALKSLGYKPDHPAIKKGMEGLAPFIVEDGQTLRMQPATSTIWDTAWSTLALLESGLKDNHPALVKSGRWLLKEEIRTDGDWKIKNPHSDSGCWAFEFDNDIYPDIDDTSVVARALLNIKLTEAEETSKMEAAGRGLRWVKEMQSLDGGWAAFDRDNDKQVLANVPYADFMTPLDPTSADVTAHAVDLFSQLDPQSPSLKRALKYLKETQEPDGTWYGRWGVNYIYGTGLVMACLKSAGEDMKQKYIQKAVEWLNSRQNPDGSWGETCETYRNPALKGTGPGTASQTAWALLGLLAAGQQYGLAVEKGIRYLLRNQNPDGTWTEEPYTGTGFPGAFYLRYDLYRIYFPLLVLGQYRAFLEDKNG